MSVVSSCLGLISMGSILFGSTAGTTLVISISKSEDSVNKSGLRIFSNQRQDLNVTVHSLGNKEFFVLCFVST